MMKIILQFRTAAMCLALSLTASFCGVWASAQTTAPTLKPIISSTPKDNPFDFVLGAAENPVEQKQVRGLSYQRSSIRVGKLAVKSKLKAPLQYRKKFYQSPKQAQTLYETLVRKYGEPKSVRGKSHIWDIKNPNRGGRQADIVTIILKMHENGSYELIMDRDRGENGQATWAAPRLQKLKVKPVKQQKTKAQPILQPDND